jgi:hypothetical protein
MPEAIMTIDTSACSPARAADEIERRLGLHGRAV